MYLLSVFRRTVAQIHLSEPEAAAMCYSAILIFHHSFDFLQPSDKRDIVLVLND